MSEEGVKSARRVFEILEYFKKEQRELSVKEVAQHCRFPQSSTSALMRTMTEIGYLHFDRHSRTYRPTLRLPLLVDWVSTRLFRSDRVFQLMKDLSNTTGETIILGAENGPKVRYVHVIEATGPLRLHAIAGESRPYATSAIGLALLSTWERRRILRFFRRLNDEEPDPARHVNVNELLSRVEEVERDGYALSVGGITPVGGAVAMVLPHGESEQTFAIAVSGFVASVNSHAADWVTLMRERIGHYFPDCKVQESVEP